MATAVVIYDEALRLKAVLETARRGRRAFGWEESSSKSHAAGTYM
jgi:hypothetical protein